MSEALDIPVVPGRRDIERLEESLLQLEQADVPLVHRFSDGAYVREVFMRAGLLVIGHEHKTRHFNIVLTGKAMVMMDGVVQRIEAPAIFESEPGVRKVLYILEDMRWATLHVTPERSLEVLEDILIVKSAAHQNHQLMQDAQRLRSIVESDQPEITEGAR